MLYIELDKISRWQFFFQNCQYAKKWGLQGWLSWCHTRGVVSIYTNRPFENRNRVNTFWWEVEYIKPWWKFDDTRVYNVFIGEPQFHSSLIYTDTLDLYRYRILILNTILNTNNSILFEWLGSIISWHRQRIQDSHSQHNGRETWNLASRYETLENINTKLKISRLNGGGAVFTSKNVFNNLEKVGLRYCVFLISWQVLILGQNYEKPCK